VVDGGCAVGDLMGIGRGDRRKAECDWRGVQRCIEKLPYKAVSRDVTWGVTESLCNVDCGSDKIFAQ
jgi:hypothetical protein